MIVPKYWAEAKLKSNVNGRQLTLKRFGWSDSSEENAKAHAEQRVADAMTSAKNGESVRKVDHKYTYNGSEGLPIREEVIEKYGETVISRNPYGALCLNTPDILFADIDNSPNQTSSNAENIFIFAIVLAVIVGAVFKLFIVATVIAFAGYIISKVIRQTNDSKKEENAIKNEQNTLSHIREYAAKNPDVKLRVYKTPNGYRVLAMHKTFSPNADDTQALLSALSSDKIYIQMCKNQQCFRARVSPKPWRIDMKTIRPNNATWPVKDEWLPIRTKWVQEYQAKSKTYSACKFLEEIGYGKSISEAESVAKIHDDLSQAHKSLPLA